MNGFCLVDKPQGISSFDVIRQLRRSFRTKKMGHVGTLDPMATGLLPIAVGHCTRWIPYTETSDKTYEAVIRFGAETNTDDAEGTVTREAAVPADLLNCVAAVAEDFRGSISQVPPQFSAIHINGQRAYKLARKGEQVDIPARTVVVHTAEFEASPSTSENHEIVARFAVSKGTYIRSLARDIGRAIGSAAHLCSLRRTQCGDFSITESRPLEVWMADEAPQLLSGARMLNSMPALRVDREVTRALGRGQRPAFESDEVAEYLMRSKDGADPDDMMLWRAMLDGVLVGVVSAEEYEGAPCLVAKRIEPSFASG